MQQLGNATQRLGAFAARCGREPLTAEVAEKAGMCLLDSLGLAIAARNEMTAVAMRQATTPVSDSRGTARIWADGTRVVLSEAVTANAVAVHAHFQDDTDHNSWSHPGSLIAPVAICLGETTNAPLSTVLRSIVSGYTTIEWLGADEIVARALIARGLRASPTFGTVGAAAAAAVVLGLDDTQATNAVGMASSITGGVLEPVRCGSDEWRVQNGHAARGGLTAAQLAQRGVLGAPDGLEGPKGLLRSLAGLSETPAKWRADPDVGIMLSIMAKPWATLGDNMPVAAAARLLHVSGVELDRVTRIVVQIWRPYAEYPGTSFKGPYKRIVQTQASTAFAAAAMLVYGKLDYDMGVKHRTDARILRLVQMTTIEPHDGRALDATVTLELSDGTIVQREARQSPRNLIFQDRKTATEVLEQRLVGGGYPSGTGVSLANAVFDTIERGSGLDTRAILDRLITNR